MRRIELPYQPWQGCVLPLYYFCNKWRSRWDSNPRSPPWQGGMLTTTPLDQIYHFINGGEGGIWTLAPVSRPIPLAGAPLQPLEYFSMLNYLTLVYNIMRFWVWQDPFLEFMQKIREVNGSSCNSCKEIKRMTFIVSLNENNSIFFIPYKYNSD